MRKRRKAKMCMLVILALFFGCLPGDFTKANEVEKKEYVAVIAAGYEEELLNSYAAKKVDQPIAYDYKKASVVVLQMDREIADNMKDDPNVYALGEELDIHLSSDDVDIPEEEPLTYEEEIQWNIQAVGVDAIAESEREVEHKIRVGIIDSGIDPTDEIEVAGYAEFIGDEVTVPILQDFTGHGTSVAGVIGSKLDGQGIAGVNPNTEIYSLRVFNEVNVAPLSRIAAAVEWAIENEMDILNMSFATDVNSPVLAYEISQAQNAGILIVAAAGNNGGEVMYPAAYEGVLGVGAVDVEMQLAEFTARGEGVDIYAPGVNILSNNVFWGYMAVDGTSIATAHVSGVASLIWQAYPDKSNEEVAQAILCGAVISPEAYPVVNAENAKEVLTSIELEETYIPVFDVIPEYEGEVYIEGMWGGSGHPNLVTTGNSELASANRLTGEQLKIAKTYAKRADTLFLSTTGTYQSSVHARGNYVANGRYLFNAAVYYKSLTATAKTSPSVMYADSSFLGDMTGHNTSQLQTVISTIYNDTNVPLYGEESTVISMTNNARIAAALLGVAIHTATDTFAHRTIVSSTSGLSSSYFGGSNGTCNPSVVAANCTSQVASGYNAICQHWNCLSTAISGKYVDTIDIKYFQNGTYYKDGTIYEDNISYLPARYNVASKQATKVLIYCYVNNTRWQRRTLTPIYNNINYTLRTENLKTYYTAAGLDTSFLTSTQWSTISHEQ